MTRATRSGCRNVAGAFPGSARAVMALVALPRGTAKSLFDMARLAGNALVQAFEGKTSQGVIEILTDNHLLRLHRRQSANPNEQQKGDYFYS